MHFRIVRTFLDLSILIFSKVIVPYRWAIPLKRPLSQTFSWEKRKNHGATHLKQGSCFFSPKNSFKPIFNLKHLENNLEALLNQSIALKNTKKKKLKTQNQPKTKNLFKLRSVYLGTFKVKTPNSNFSHYIESFNTKIDRFSGHNYH